MFTKYFFITVFFLIAGCSNYNPEHESITYKIEQYRIQKDLEFKDGAASPLLAEDKASFKGLDYFPIDLNLRFEGEIVKYDSMILDTIWGTRGDRRPAYKFGKFNFMYQENEYSLQVFKMQEAAVNTSQHLFLGFTDETRNHSTYGGGRYIDLTENTENYYVVDFNMAYNPYCVYNPDYSCAIPSTENHLNFKVEAGEKNFVKK